MAEMNLRVARGFKTGTKIQSIEVPPALRIKRTSGIPWLDEAIGGEGGFTPTATWMLTGAPGAGKSTLLRQLADSMTKAGHLVVKNTGEESLYQDKMAAERLGLTSDFMVGEEVMLPKLLTFMDNLRKDAKHKGKHVVLLQDSIQTLDDGKYVDAKGHSRGTTGKTPTYCAEMLVAWAQATYSTVVFIGQCTKAGIFAGQNKVKHAVDGHMHMHFDMKPKSETYGNLLLEVDKNRWGCSGKAFILELTKTGIVSKGTFDKVTGTRSDEEPDDEAVDDDMDDAAQ